ncbi:MAG TPA: hypothetical protein VG322_15610 [Candidatus Acidoferrales bacterium]|nr:hypothetical protein [Candidatus Acidoferrales bacterium]
MSIRARVNYANHGHNDAMKNLYLSLHPARCEIVGNIHAVARGNYIGDDFAEQNDEPGKRSHERQADTMFYRRQNIFGERRSGHRNKQG